MTATCAQAQVRVVPAPSAAQAPRVSYANSPLTFEVNKGQSEAATRYTAAGRGYTVKLEDGGVLLELQHAGPSSKSEAGKPPALFPVAQVAPSRLELRLLGANAKPGMTASLLQPGVSNYYPSRDPATWHSRVPSYGRVEYSEVYPGISLAFYGQGLSLQGQSLEYDFHLKAGVDAALIGLGIGDTNQAKVDASVDGSGRLVLRTDGAVAQFLKPVGYQLGADGARQPVAVEYRLTRDNHPSDHAQWEVSFNVGQHDPARDVVIDPVLSYGSYFPSLETNIGGIAADASGNTYITGAEQGRGFYVNKYGPTGTLLLHTVVGAGVTTSLGGIAIDSTGNAYVAGEAYTGLPTTSNAYLNYTGTKYVAFVAVIPAAGGAPTYLSYLGGNAYDLSTGIAVLGSGNFYITGYESSTNFPTTAGAYLSTFPGASYAAYVAKFDPALSGAASLSYSTLVGAAGLNSIGTSIAADSTGAAYIAVQSSQGYPVSTGAFQYTGIYPDQGTNGAYITKLNSGGTGITYSAYLGPGSPSSIALDTNGDVYATGIVQADDFPVTSGAYQTTYPGGFVTELNPAGTALVYSTFLSGPSGATSPSNVNVNPQSIAIARSCASACVAYVAGYTSSTDFPAINPLQSSVGTGSYGPYAFVAALAGNGASATYSTYLNGLTSTVNGNPYGTPVGVTPSVAVDSTGDVYLAANVSGTDFPSTLPVPTSSGAYLAKISPVAGGLVIADPLALNFDSINYAGEAVGVSSALNGIPIPLVLQNFGDAAVTISSLAFTPSTEFSETDSCAGSIPAGGRCTLNLALTPAAAGKRTATLAINSNAVVSPVDVAVSATAYAEGYLQISAPQLTFSDQMLGTTSSVQTITISNIGKSLVNLQPIALSSVAANKGNGSDFLALDNCPAQLLPASSCTVGVSFTPVATGLRGATFYVQGDGFGNQSVYLYGEGLASSSQGSVSLSGTILNFNTQLVNTSSPRQSLVFTNTSSSPVSIYSVTIATAGQTGTSDFSIVSGSCQNTSAIEIEPQATCSLNIEFTPSAAIAETGTITFVDSATGSPQKVSLTGVGLALAQALEFTPGSSVFPDQPVGVLSASQTFYVYNTSTAPVTIDRLLVAGDFLITSTTCPGATLKPGPAAGVYITAGCSLRVQFSPTATGVRNGTLTFVDPAGGNPQVLSLTGNGITATGAIFPEPASLAFGSQAVGVSSATQRFTIVNPGNSPVTINNVATTGDYALAAVCNSTPPIVYPVVLTAGRTCPIDIGFTPISTTNPRSGTAVVYSSAGNASVPLTGSGVGAVSALGLTPTSLDFGNVVTAAGSALNLYVRNTGSEAVTLTSGAATGDYTFSGGSCGFYGNLLAPGASCYTQITLTPTVAGTRTGVVTLTDSAGTQTANLTGIGVAANSGLAIVPHTIGFDQVPVGSTSPSPLSVSLHNYTASPVTISSAKISVGGAAFLIPSGTDACTGVAIPVNSSCSVQVSFAPTAAGYLTGTLTFTDSTSKTYSASLAGYSPAVSVSAYVDPGAVAFPGQVLTTISTQQTISLINSSDVPLTVGTLTGTNTIVGASTTGVFSASGTQGGYDGCSGVQVAPRAKCTVNVVFAPTTAGSATGSLTFPVTYGNKTTAQLVATLSGTGLAIKDSAELSPANLTFQDQTVGAVYGNGADSPETILLYDTGNLPFTVGALTGTDTVVGSTLTGDFSTASALGGYDGCTNQVVSPGAYCQVTVGFNPSSAAVKAGKISFPVTYSDKTVTTVSANLSGKGVAANSKILVSPASGQFDVQVVGTTSDSSETLTFNITDTGNLPVKFATSTITSNFSFVSDSCSGTTLAINSACSITVAFSPTASGVITGTLTIPDNAAGNPHKIALTGTGIPASQQIVLSQTAVTFPNQVVSTKSTFVYVTVSNQSGATVPVSTAVLSGTNASDFIMNDGCSGQAITGHSNCILAVQFAPAAASLGVRTAKITETDSATGSPRTITLTGTGIASAPSLAFYPASLNFGSQALNTVSSPLTFSVTNTGSASLTITHVASTNATEFPVKTQNCTTAAIAPGGNCLVSVTFDPNAGSTQTASIQITDNATGSPQSLTVSGLSVGTPTAALSPTSLTFASQGVGVASAAQSITLSNAGTDTLLISSIAVGGTNASDFHQTNTCGTSIVAKTTCTVSVTFTPTATGSRAGSIVVTDNAGNVTGTQQTATLAGTGTGVAKITLSPTSLGFTARNVGTTSGQLQVTVSNPGSAPLTLSSIAIGGTNPGDFHETTTCVSPLAVSGTCAVTVTFTPTAAGARAASLNFTDNAAASPQAVTLTGTGVGVATASLSTTALNFNSQAIGVASSALPVTLTNTGSGPLTVASLVIGGTNGTNFTETSTTCPGTLAAGANCVINVTFKPTAAGARSGTLTITDNTGNVTGSTQVVTLSGTGAGTPQVSFSPTSFTFGSANVGAFAGPVSITVSNPGNGPLSVSSIALSGTDPGDYLEFDTCRPTLAAGGTCEIALYFIPKGTGTRTANVVVTDNANNVVGATQGVPATGTGLGTPEAALSVSTLAFGTVKVGTESSGQFFTLSNTGNTALSVASVTVTGTNAADYSAFNSCTPTVSASSSCTVVVFFKPTATGARSATVTVTDNSGGTTGTVQSVTLTGTGD